MKLCFAWKLKSHQQSRSAKKSTAVSTAHENLVRPATQTDEKIGISDMSRVPKETSVVLKSLDTMSVGDLEAVRRKAQALIEQKLLDRKQQAIDELRSVAATYGFDLEELVTSRMQQQSNQHNLRKPSIYYVHPDNPDLTWTGRGRRPKWFQELLAKGIVPPKNENND